MTVSQLQIKTESLRISSVGHRPMYIAIVLSIRL